MAKSNTATKEVKETLENENGELVSPEESKPALPWYETVITQVKKIVYENVNMNGQNHAIIQKQLSNVYLRLHAFETGLIYRNEAGDVVSKDFDASKLVKEE